LKRVPFSALVLMAERMVSDQSYSKIRRLRKLQPRNLMATISVNDMLKSPSFPMVTTSDLMDRLVVDLTTDKQSNCPNMSGQITRRDPWLCVACLTRSKFRT
jgi:hypothetical protein